MRNYAYTIAGSPKLQNFEAHNIGIVDGALVFYINDNMALALAPGIWTGFGLANAASYS